jgi:hypothetical protein
MTSNVSLTRVHSLSISLDGFATGEGLELLSAVHTSNAIHVRARIVR